MRSLCDFWSQLVEKASVRHHPVVIGNQSPVSHRGRRNQVRREAPGTESTKLNEVEIAMAQDPLLLIYGLEISGLENKAGRLLAGQGDLLVVGI
jgi:hypothetical protein